MQTNDSKLDSYSDPSNTQDILKQISNTADLGGVREILDKVFPTWIVGMIPNYSKDYPHLQNNWDLICKKLGVERTSILVVENIVQDEHHVLIQTFAELLCRSGFCVRRKSEFFPCYKCGAALPTQILYDLMKEKMSHNIPKNWGTTCSTC